MYLHVTTRTHNKTVLLIYQTFFNRNAQSHSPGLDQLSIICNTSQSTIYFFLNMYSNSDKWYIFIIMLIISPLPAGKLIPPVRTSILFPFLWYVAHVTKLLYYGFNFSLIACDHYWSISITGLWLLAFFVDSKGDFHCTKKRVSLIHI